jgi:hypothetical protein
MDEAIIYGVYCAWGQILLEFEYILLAYPARTNSSWLKPDFISGLERMKMLKYYKNTKTGKM